MRLAEFYCRVKARIWHSADLPKDVFVLLVICSVGFGAFLLGRMSAMETSRKAELRIIQTASLGVGEGVVPRAVGDPASDPISTGTKVQGAYVGSRNGTTYYLPWCGGVKLIHEENKVWFKSKEEAVAKGYKPAGNCKGI